MLNVKKVCRKRTEQFGLIRNKTFKGGTDQVAARAAHSPIEAGKPSASGGAGVVEDDGT